MAPVNSRSLQRRDNPAISIAIIIGVVSVIIIIGIAIWGFLLPALCKKPPVRYSDEYLLNLRDRRNRPPSPRPTLLRKILKKPKKSVPRYNPRLESPFPSRPVPLSTLRYEPTPPPFSRTYLVNQSVNHNGGLFAPARAQLPPRRDIDSGFSEVLWKNEEVPNQKAASGLNGLHEYILPVPEPLPLKPRPAGRPPPLTRQLQKFPIPTAGLSRKGGLIHPGKLFRELEQHDSSSVAAKASNTSAPNSGTAEHSFSTESTTWETTHAHPFTEDLQLNQVHSEGSTTLSRRREPIYDHSHPLAEGQECFDPYTGINASNPRHLSRTGMLTRPETSFAEIRQRFDREASKENSQAQLPKRGWTPASNPFTTPGGSSTAQTSPVASRHSPPTLASQSDALMHVGDKKTSNPGLRSRRRTPSSAALPSPTKLTSSKKLEPSKTINRLSRKLSPANVFGKRTNPTPPLDVMSATKPRDPTQRHSLSSLSTVFKPMLGCDRNRQSPYASSTYSRETRGMSSTGSPGLDGMFPDNNHLTVPNYRTDLLVDTQKHGRTGSMEDVRSKIDEWDLHTENLYDSSFYLAPSKLKRTISDFGPRRSPAFDSRPALMSIEDVQETRGSTSPALKPKIRIEECDDEVWDNGLTSARNSALAPPAGQGQSTRQASSGHARQDSQSQSPMPGTAPGGSEWI
ncbi:hypothetical protein PV08_05394 [Exophiala spinifera]|uniref:Uncharacterized protein n=1 Tax=Exophiala spinifera TaxID=91928 RepID=A0A0D2B8U6_9EURO|nr:uncharacterized protein PV08_05394 [Exophiala spinifera]KIW15348.1 hypothetical protein PV08_05394 [Exophiala spinifera]